ncbi:MAG: PadR family transcriptional regulator [Candidatus Methanomethylicaceae archaeon]
MKREKEQMECEPLCICHAPEIGLPMRCVPMKEVVLRGLLHLGILSILKDKELHGSGIHQRLKEKFGIEPAKPIVYTMLRRMEMAGLVVSEWETGEGGPAKRLYRITEEGLDYLNDSTRRLGEAARIIKTLLGELGGSDGQRS